MFYFWTERQQQMRSSCKKGHQIRKCMRCYVEKPLRSVKTKQCQAWPDREVCKMKKSNICVSAWCMREPTFTGWGSLPPPFSKERRRTAEKDIQIHPHLSWWPLWKYPKVNQDLHISWAGHPPPEFLTRCQNTLGSDIWHSERWIIKPALPDWNRLLSVINLLLSHTFTSSPLILYPLSLSPASKSHYIWNVSGKSNITELPIIMWSLQPCALSEA